MAKEVRYSITEITVHTGKPATLGVLVDDQKVSIPMDADLKAYFDAQFSRKNPTAEQRKKFATIMNLMKAAYRKGVSDGKGE